MVKFDMEHVLILLIVAFVLYHLMNRCSCFNNGFSVGGVPEEHEPCYSHSYEFTCKLWGDKRGCVWRDGECIDK